MLFCSINSDPITAACPEPMPGRNEQKGEEIIAAEQAFPNSFFVNFISLRESSFCFSMPDLFFIEIKRAETPKRPVNKGIRGSFIGRLKVKRPRSPDNAKTRKDEKMFSSLKIRKRDIKIKIKGIIKATRP